MTISDHVALDSQQARQLYLDELDPKKASADWYFARREARKLVSSAMRGSRFLSDIATALEDNCAHSLVFRQLMAPPLSQDQFKMICPAWSKLAENKGRPLNRFAAEAASSAIEQRLDRSLIKSGPRSGSPTEVRLHLLYSLVASRIALQKISTARRNRLAFEQEYAVVLLLENAGWTKMASRLIDTRAAVPSHHFMRKTRFATKSRPQEVDIACGLGDTYVLAMECKVTNDETNSVKRVNDVLKKASAWKEHWGSFVIPAALLQGVIAPKDVQRLIDAGVTVFWSHKLPEFGTWLSSRIAARGGH